MTTRKPLIPSRSARAGLTLIELMMALGLLGILMAIAIPQFRGYRGRAITRQAVLDIESIAFRVRHFRDEFSSLPINLAGVISDLPLDPWGNAYEYLNLEAGLPGTEGTRRRDKNLNPINSSFDLYSKGPDGQSQAQLVAAYSRDDIVFAADGDFVGIAEDF